MIGDPPSEKREEFANFIAENNMTLLYSKNASIARNPEFGAYVLRERISVEQCDFVGFCEHLQKFAATLELYHKSLTEFTSAAQQATTIDAAQKDDLIDALNSGFIRA